MYLLFYSPIFDFFVPFRSAHWRVFLPPPSGFSLSPLPTLTTRPTTNRFAGALKECGRAPKSAGARVSGLLLKGGPKLGRLDSS